jgi:hypothetical protein
MRIRTSYPGQPAQECEAPPHIVRHFRDRGYQLPFVQLVSITVRKPEGPQPQVLRNTTDGVHLWGSKIGELNIMMARSGTGKSLFSKCCANEKRNMQGGCVNCGDPCL